MKMLKRLRDLPMIKHMFSGRSNKKVRKPLRRGQRIISFEKVGAEISCASTKQIVGAKVILNDLNAAGLGCFVADPIEKGERVNIVIEKPHHIYIKGEVVWCYRYVRDTKVICAEEYSFRIGIRFTFDTPDEKEVISKYCADLLIKKAA